MHLLGSALQVVCAMAMTELARAQQSGIQFGISCYDDLNRSVEGTLAQIDALTGSPALIIADEQGRTDPVAVAPSAPVIVTLAATSCTRGVTLGQMYAIQTPPLPAGVTTYYFTQQFHQPIALPTYISSAKRAYAKPYHDRWVIDHTEGAQTIGFQAHVAILLTNREIDGYANYEAVQFTSPSDPYSVGVMVRSRDVDLGDHNFVMSVDCKGHEFNIAPSVDCYIVRGSTLPTPPTLSARVVFWEGEVATMLLSGQLERGDNLFLLRTAGGTKATERLLSAPPELEIPPPTSAALPADCQPVCPPEDGTWSCTIDPPSGTNGCYAPVLLRGPDCGYGSSFEGKRVCGDSGSGEDVETGWSFGGSVAVTFKKFGLTWEGTGEYEWHVSRTRHLVCGDGLTCGEEPNTYHSGQCKQLCRKVVHCTATYRVERDGFETEWINPERMSRRRIPCAEKETVEVSCDDDGTSDGVCNRACD